jgi:hypothetical protein
MRKIKTFEDIKTISSSDLDGTWNPKDHLDKDRYTGSKNLNKNLGSKMLEVFEEYGFFVQGFGPGDWLNKSQIVLPPEQNLREFRVSLGLKDTWENFLDSNGYSEEEFDELEVNEQQKLEKEFNEQGDIADTNMEFSVFLPNGTKDIQSGLADAFQYLKLVQNSIPDMYANPYVEDVIKNEPEQFKKFINNKGIQISNNNIEIVPVIDYRLYKDSKFFYNLKEACDDHDIDYKDLINDLLNIK